MENHFFLTRISSNNMGELKKDMTPGEIIKFLESGAIFRTFRDVLEKVYPNEDLNSTLAKRLEEMTGGNYDHIARNVRNWLNRGGANVPQREQLFQICFALGLTDVQANQVIASTSETGIHYRNPEELVYAYCLRNGKSWQEAQALKEKMLKIYEDECKDAPGGKRHEKGGKVDGVPSGYTRQIQKEFEAQVKTDQDLEVFFRNHARQLGYLHEAAYKKFMEMLKWLQSPGPEGEKRSIGAVVDEFMRMSVPANTPKARGKREKESQRDYTYLQRAIKKNWPSESIISKMKLRERDVSRKVLLLLFLLTEEFEVSSPGHWDSERPAEEEEDFLYLEELGEKENPSELMEIRLTQINLFLDDYGMNRLDPGNPFDCLVLYALKASYEGEGDNTMDRRFKNALEILFFDGDKDKTEKNY